MVSDYNRRYQHSPPTPPPPPNRFGEEYSRQEDEETLTSKPFQDGCWLKKRRAVQEVATIWRWNGFIRHSGGGGDAVEGQAAVDKVTRG